MTLVEVSHLNRTFRMGRGADDVTAVDDVSFTIEHGEAVGLVGESGSGKSTIARILVGLERADSGRVVVDGDDRLSPSRGARARLRRARAVQMVFQDPNSTLDRRLTIEQTLQRTLRLHDGAKRDKDRRAIPELLDRVGLTERHANAKPHQLSGGQRQRVAIARALALRPQLLVLDESVSALDVSVQAQVLSLLAEIQHDLGISYLFVSHDLAVIDQLCQRALVLFRGRIVEQGDTARILTRPEHSYTKLLIASTPGPGWDPEQVVRAKVAFTQSLALPTTRGK